MPRVEFEGQIHEFPDDFTDADIAAALGGGGQQQSDSGQPLAAPAAFLGVKTIPGIVALTHKAAQIAEPFAGMASRFLASASGVPGIISGPASQAAPSAVRAVASATAPASTVPSSILGANGAPMMRAVPPGWLARIAGTVGKAAGPAGLIAQALFDPMPKEERRRIR